MLEDRPISSEIETKWRQWTKAIGLADKLRTARLSKIIDGEVFFSKEKDIAMRASEARERAELEKMEANMAPAGRGGRQGGAPGAQSFTPPENH